MLHVITRFCAIIFLMNGFAQETAKKDSSTQIIYQLTQDFNLDDLQSDGTPLIRAVRLGNLNLVKKMVEKGADVNKGKLRDGSPLIEASRFGYLEIVKYLIDKKADVNIHVIGDETPLIRAAWNGHLEVVKYLVEHGANVNMTVREGYKLGSEKRNALRMAKKGNHKKVIAYLISKGAKK